MDHKKELRTNFFNFTTQRPVAILMVVIGVVVFGLISYQQLPLNLMPDMTYPSLTVRTEYPGTAPQEIETTISRPIEQALGVVDNLVTISSVSKAEQSDVILEFTWDTDMNKATADIREKLDQVFLPQEVNRPIILRYDPSLDPIMRVGVYGEQNLTYLRYLAEEEIKRALETVDGVAAVKVKGGLEEEIRVELNEQQLTLIGMDIQTVRQRLSEENVNLAGGNLKEGQTEYLVRTLNEFKSVEQIREVVVGRYNNVNIKVKDIGKVTRTHKEREVITRISGEESVEIEIFKEADANIVAVAEAVRNKLYGTPAQQAYVKQLESGQPSKEKEKKAPQNQRQARQEGLQKKQMTNFLTYSLPEGVNISTLSDQSIFIKNSIDEVKSTAVMGGILAIIVLFIFLRLLGPTVIIGLAIPISVVATFAPMKIFDVSLNIMSLGGLALGIGMLVDNSIVVLESIARCREEGDDFIRATLRGVSEVGGAVIASTLTTIAVFFPIVFVEGVAGQVFGDLALTVVFALLASLAVALFLIPMLSSRRTEQFVKGAQLDKLPKKFILSDNISEQIGQLFSVQNQESILTKLKTFLTLLIKAILFWVFKSTKTFAALFITVIKQFALFVLLVMQIPVGIINVFKKEKWGYGSWLKKWSVSSHGLDFIVAIWQDYLKLNNVNRLYTDFGQIVARFKRYTIVKKIGYIPVSIIHIVFYFISYVLNVFLELTFRFLHAVLLLIVLFMYMLYLIARLILTLPAGFVVFLFDKTYAIVDRSYPTLLRKSLDNRYSLSGFVLVLFLLTIFVVGPQLGRELIPEVHQGEFNVELTLPIGTPVEENDERIQPIQEDISQLDGVNQVASVAGTDKTATTDSDEGEHTAKITVTLRPSRNPAALEEDVIAKIRDVMKEYPGIESNISRPTIFSFKTPVEVYLKGYNLDDLQRYSRLLEERMQTIPGLVDAKSNIQRGNPEVQIYYDRELIARHGMNVRNVASIVRNKVRGDVATEFKEEDRRIDVLVRLREEDKESINDLRRLVVNPDANVPIALQTVADIRVNEGPSEIRRVGQQRTALITANLAPGANLSEINSQIYDEIQDINLPSDFAYELAGQNKEMQTSLNSLSLALALAIFLVYIVMASQFESLLHPFVIIFTIPMALIGVILFLYVFDIPLSIVVFLGMIMLAGIVVNNAIVLVDYINHLRRGGMEKLDAIMQAGQARLRPILMTTATTVLGLLPMAIGMGDGAEIRTPMAITVIIGLISSTILTLVIIPTVYSIFSKQ
ncbi:MAG: AcrB/AcrD/AcrF family protein [Caldithrix sp.]|nr:AcrB/AcrD/AcrF family protein [Caldithrix sp.]